MALGLTRPPMARSVEGVGLRNTRARLQQLYNHDHMLILEDRARRRLLCQHPHTVSRVSTRR